MGVVSRVRATGPSEKNVGGLERAARLTLGVTLLGLVAAVATGFGTGVAPSPTLRLILAGVGLLAGARLLWTGVTQKCRLNRRFGRNSYRG